MPTATVKKRCVKCQQEKASVKCEGCSQTFCYNHINEHRQELSKQLDEIETTRERFRQRLKEQIADPRKHSLIQQIDEWESDSINKIRQVADEARQLLLEHIPGHVIKIKSKLTKFTAQIQENRQENDFIETDLNQWKEELTRLRNELDKQSNIIIRQDTAPFITKIFVEIPILSNIPSIDAGAKWHQDGITIAGGNGGGSELNQLYNTLGIYIDNDQTLYVADQSNHRVVEWNIGETSGKVVAGGNGPGNQSNQLNGPAAVLVDKATNSLIISDCNNKRVVRWPLYNGTSGETIVSDVASQGLAMDSDGYLYVSDYNKHEVKRWKIGEKNGIVVAGGNGNGNRLDQLNHPTYIVVDHDHSIYVSDGHNHRVTKWVEGAKEGIIVAGGQGQGSSLAQLSNPRGIVVDQSQTVYVVDYSNYRVVRWIEGAKEGTVVVGGNGQGAETNQFNSCWDLSFDRQGNLYVSDWCNHRVQKFNINSISNDE